ncbi:MAG: hypothetical protein ACPGOV_03090 [Magnetovibrionaceae bacterium]
MLARVIGLALSLGLLTACQTVNPNLNKERPITEAESVLALTAPEASRINFKRFAISRVRSEQEVWRWPGGEALYVALHPGRFLRDDYTSASQLIEMTKRWQKFSEDGVSFTPESARSGANGFGRFVYAMADAETRLTRCIAFSQNAGGTTSSDGKMSGSGNSNAFIFGYDCRKIKGLDAQTQQKEFLAVITRLKPKS